MYMLYVTTYYDNVKSCRRVGRLPTAGRGGGHPQAASFVWRATPVDGDGLLVGETRPVEPVGSICPDTKNAPSCDGAEKLRNIACPAKPPRTANRLLRSPRRQTKLSAETPPSVSAGLYCNGPPGPISSLHRETHFRKRSRLSGRGASLAAACAAPDGLRSYRPIGQTLLTGSPPLSFDPHGATRCGRERGSPFRLQLLRSVAPLSQQHD